MISDARIQNFRGIRDLHVTGLRRLNLIVGDNGSGKTSVLEAIYLASGGSPDLVGHMREARGLASHHHASSVAEWYMSLWKDIFRAFDYRQKIEITLDADRGRPRKLEISATPAHGTQFPRHVAAITAAGMHIVHFTWTSPDGKQHRTMPIPTAQGVTAAPLLVPVMPTSFVQSAEIVTSTTLAQMYSELSKLNREDFFTDFLRRQFPDVISLSIETELGVASLFARVKHIPEKIPFSMISGGLTRFARYLLEMPLLRNGAIFVDEIENGFHYSRQEYVLATVLAFAKEFNVQIFATTHSFECLLAAAAVLEDDSSDLSLIQVFKEDGETKALMSSGSEAIAAVRSGIELRT